MNDDKTYSKEFEILRCYNILNLCHFTHIDNLSSISREGLLSEEEIERRKIKYTSIADSEVKARRKERMVHLRNYYKWDDHQEKTVYQCVPLYISIKNPMLYKVLHEYKNLPENIIHIKVDTLKVIGKNYCFFDGNAASDYSRLYIKLENLEKLDWEVIKQSSWANDEEKRKKCAEFLVYPKVEPKDFYQIVVFNEKAKIRVEESLKMYNLQLEGGIRIDQAYYIWHLEY